MTWGSHSVDCYPGGCSWQVFSRDGKHLGFAAGYGYLPYRPLSWQPIPADRAVRVDVEKVG